MNLSLHPKVQFVLKLRLPVTFFLPKWLANLLVVVTSFCGILGPVSVVPAKLFAQSSERSSKQVGGEPSDFKKSMAGIFPTSTDQEGLSVRSLVDGWEFRRDGKNSWKPIHLPCPFEAHEGVLFDGVGWYRKSLPCVKLDAATQHLRALLRFQGAATKTKVWCNGVLVAEHLGGWTPFECDISKFLLKPYQKGMGVSEGGRDDRPSQESNQAPPFADSVELLVEVDELVGHNSQGFLPVFAPHFGGLWKPVELLIRYPVAIDVERVHLWGDLGSSMLKYEVPLRSYDVSTLGGFLDARNTYVLRIEHSLVPDQGVKHGNSDKLSDRLERSWIQTDRTLTTEELQQLLDDGNGSLSGAIHIPNPATWSPESPRLYDVRISLQETASNPSAIWDGSDRKELHWIFTKAAFRSIRADGDQLMLNGKPLTVRGVLNWGYAPPSTAPSLDPDHWRAELQLVKDYGFNLIKFCLWIPPKGYLELADEMGVLVWMEYPTWHSKWTKDQLPTLAREFDEFFFYDRNHPCVILRSLTCETGPSADIDVIRTLYDQCHERIPNSIVEDDSSWIQWNRVHDFYDDHPYGNNHTWAGTLERLKNYISEHGVKPLVLGEAIAADTWVVPNSLESQVRGAPGELLDHVRRDGQEQPFWWPLAYRANHEWVQSRVEDMGAESVTRLEEDSKRYAMLMRKFQIEAFRNQIPQGGYVVSVIRDFPFAAMGLMDYQGKPKWGKATWSWHGENMLVLQTPGDRRSFWKDAPFQGKICFEGFLDKGNVRTNGFESSVTQEEGPPRSLSLQQTWTCSDRTIKLDRTVDPSAFEQVGIVASRVGRDARGRWRLKPIELADPFGEPDGTETNDLARFGECWNLRVRLVDGDTTLCENEWDLWRLPKPRLSLKEPREIDIGIHSHCSTALRQSLAFVMNELGLVSKFEIAEQGAQSQNKSEVAIRVASRFDPELVDFLEQGGRVLMLPDGESGSFPLVEHWFLRGGPIIHSESSWNERHPMVRDLQHFDLAGRVIPDVKWLDEMTPLVMLWDNHDIASVKTHGLVFACRLGKGLMLVDAFQHGDGSNAAGMTMLADDLRWLAQRGPDDADEMDARPRIADLDAASIQSIRDKLQEKRISLVDLEWRFLPDRLNEGLERGWNKAELEESQVGIWKEIRIGKHWDSQGYGGLDGWAWYRVNVPVPEDLRQGPLYLWVDGADDYIEVFADGELVGSSGDRETRETAFEQRSSFKLTDHGPESGMVTIAIRVEDWQGAGGLFRPIWLSNIDRRDRRELLK